MGASEFCIDKYLLWLSRTVEREPRPGVEDSFKVILLIISDTVSLG